MSQFSFPNEDLDLHAEGFRDALTLQPQVELNLVREAVDYDDNPEAGDYVNSDFMAPSNPQRSTSYNGPTPDKETAMERRIGFYGAWEDSAWIKNVSMLHGLSDPSSKVMQSLEAGRQRGHMREIMESLDGPGYSYTVDKDGEPITTRAPAVVTFPSTQIIPVAFRGHHEEETIVATTDANQGYTYGKINRARTMIRKATIVGGKNYLICDEDGVEVMLNKKVMTNSQYEKAEKIKEDGFGKLLGLNWIILPRMFRPDEAADVRRYFVVNSMAVKFAHRNIIEASVNRRPDRKNAVQAYYSEEISATRMLDSGVIAIDVDLTAGL